ncbi:MAG: hypothetical protein HY226_01830 [Candidatus Vogelbacteria bacterium]|nr:hypothetical protein [Candidatus Vogelbacteria bacterium]
MRSKILLALYVGLFLVIYSWYVFKINLDVNDYSDIIVAITFFFTLFSGYFIGRQNDRYTSIAEEISNTDGTFSLLYRISGAVPFVQNRVSEALIKHYRKILDSNNWAYHIVNPSTTITDVFNAYNSAIGEDADKLGQFGDAFGGGFLQLQISRKRMIMLYHQRLLLLHWALTYTLAGLMIVSFNFIPNHTLLINVLKIAFGLAVFFVILLLKQLDDLSIFGEDFSKNTANDMLRIVEEKDVQEMGK